MHNENNLDKTKYFMILTIIIYIYNNNNSKFFIDYKF